MFQWLLGVLTRGGVGWGMRREGRGRGGGVHSTCVFASIRDNVVLKGVIMLLLAAAACAPVITARPDLECCHGRIRRGSRGRGPRLMEANNLQLLPLLSKNQLLEGKHRPPLSARATRYVNMRGNLIPSFEYAS